MIMMRLAEKFGRPDVDAFLASVGSSQITEWLAYYRIDASEAERGRKRRELKSRVRSKVRGRGRG
jgi:hypothetical protein